MADPHSVIKVESSLGWTPDADEHRRAFIIENCVSQSWSINAMDELYRWLKTGALATDRPGLKSVK